MKLDFIGLGKLSVSKANMRFAKKAPDVADILPTVRKRGVVVPILVRRGDTPDAFEIVAGARRYHAALIVADERRAAGEEVDAMPCAILDAADDADAVEAALIENIARLDPLGHLSEVSFDEGTGHCRACSRPPVALTQRAGGGRPGTSTCATFEAIVWKNPAATLVSCRRGIGWRRAAARRTF